MLPDDIQQELVGLFRVELEEHLASLDKNLLVLENNPSQEEQAAHLSEIFRSAHSIKGASRAVGFEEINMIAHQIEDVLSAVQRGKLVLKSEHCNLFLIAVDAIKEAMASRMRGDILPEQHFSSILTDLFQVLHGKPSASQQYSKPVETVLTTLDENSAPVQPNHAQSSNIDVSYSNPAPAPHTPEEIALPPQNNPTQSNNPPSAPAATTARPLSIDETIRVSTSKLDVLMNNIGELMIVRMQSELLRTRIQLLQNQTTRWQKSWRKTRQVARQLQRQSNLSNNISALLDFATYNEQQIKSLNTELTLIVRQLTNDRDHLQLITDELQTGIRRVRMLPISTLFDIFPRMVRDIARSEGKNVLLKIEGAETEVDRQILELLKDPITHLLRNSIDHGIESPDQREAKGKPRQGSLNVHVEQRSNNILIEITDDGRGIDREAVRQAAIARGVLPAQEAEKLSDAEVIDLIFHSGLSTKRQVSDISGRGMGLDIVRRNIEQLHGLIQVNTTSGKSTTFTLVLPLTLATSHILLIKVANEVMALPLSNVERILKIDIDQIHNAEGKPVLFYGNRLLPLVNLARALKLPQAEQSIAPHTKIPIVVLGAAEKRIALHVDGFISAHEVVVKGLGPQLRRVRNVAGVTILGDGRVIVILNVADLMKSYTIAPASIQALPVKIVENQKKKILVVDDSITTRTLQKNIIENAGYAVLTAADGREAWELVRNEDIDLVVSDVDMPNMDGFLLTETIKRNPQTANLPVILVTSLDSPQDKLRGLEAGADSYIVKAMFDQGELLKTLERLIG